jgi:hypothetical protein
MACVLAEVNLNISCAVYLPLYKIIDLFIPVVAVLSKSIT